MGNFLDSLKAARYAPVAIRQRFRIEYNDSLPDVYAFLESTDDATFYRPFLTRRMRVGGRLRFYYCGNKQSVWYHYQFAEQEGKLTNTAFFVDKDIDDITGHALPPRDRVFVTDYYAVENYLCTVESVRALLEEIIFLPDDHNRYSGIQGEFWDGFEELAMHLRPLFAEVVVLRRMNEVVSFNDCGDGLSWCFTLENLKPTPLPDWQELFRERCKYDAAKIAPAAVAAAEAELTALQHHEWLRGKFALWFFMQFAEAIWFSLVGLYVNERKKIKKTVDLKADSIFFTMQDKHPMPARLEAFVAANIA